MALLRPKITILSPAEEESFIFPTLQPSDNAPAAHATHIPPRRGTIPARSANPAVLYPTHHPPRACSAAETAQPWLLRFGGRDQRNQQKSWESPFSQSVSHLRDQPARREPAPPPCLQEKINPNGKLNLHRQNGNICKTIKV